MKIARVISGGQTGADQAALVAAKRLGLLTGGCMPHGFATESGPRPDFALLYGIKEHPQPGSLPRTQANVVDADATLIIGDAQAGGSRDTAGLCAKHAKPCFVLPWREGEPAPLHALSDFRRWLEEHEVVILNVAGNRESEMPGIRDAALAFLLAALTR